ncbi:MAG: UDP-3-O-(3-hydroxymyristoyl)glucosamine N-acyltransferase [Bacteroidetes bacterium]|nr:UDP-3-O-(3-hydroxymyristoyl)glucosamine N-acyltransferase [Bacteroidota bacterium]
MKLRDIVDLLDAEVESQGRIDELDIVRVAKIEEAREGDITFLANPRYERFLYTTLASALIVGKGVTLPEHSDGRPGPVLIRVVDPYVSFLRVLLAFHPPRDPLPEGVHPSAVVHPSARTGEDVRIGAHAVVGENCLLGNNVMICENVVLGEGVHVGDHTLIYPNVSVRDGSRIGVRVIIQPGAVIGSDGFGFAPKPDGTYEKIPQLGIVVIEDDVEIGANTTIDRATMGETHVKRGAKLDNLVQVAHNVVIGENTVVAAQTGISGSAKIGKNCVIAGQVGLVGHIEIADKTTIAAQSGVHKSISRSGETWFGYPAHPHRQSLRMQGALTQLPDLLVAVRELQKKVEALTKELRQLKP